MLSDVSHSKFEIAIFSEMGSGGYMIRGERISYAILFLSGIL
jgi:hypothetical protein